MIAGLNQGAFRVLPDPATGRRVVTTPVIMTPGGVTPERVVRGDPARRPLPIEAFRDAVRQLIAEGAPR